jgi:alpha-maltose-1-phosphate synthase
MILLSHAGKQHSYHVANALDQLGVLERFVTSGYVTSLKLQKYALRTQNAFWSRRFHPELPVGRVEANWRFEIKEQLLMRLSGAGAQVQNAVFARDEYFDSYLSHQLNKYNFSTFWGFQGSSLLSLKAAKTRGKTTVCELSTAHVTAAKSILLEEQRLHPAWADSIDNLAFPTAYESRLENEPHEADWVVSASSFTTQTLTEAGVASNKIIHLPLGFDAGAIPFEPSQIVPYKNRPLKLLFAGRITQRKGVAYLLDAIRSVNSKDIELDLVGHIHGEGRGLLPYKGHYSSKPAVSQSELFQLYRNYDALVLPSVFEGFGLVIVEAMAAGLPVITTPNSIGPDVVENERNGYLVPVRDSQALAKAILNLAGQSDLQMYEMKLAANKAAMNFTWEKYKNNLSMIINNENYGFGIK